jgi:hypothetical protein
LEQIDARGREFARLLGGRREQETAAVIPGLFTDMAATKARRKAELVALFSGRPSQPRDTQGRWTRVGPGNPIRRRGLCGDS